jgi:enamine deaminase RidA (YjgF/YER057c/UK114 family)
VSTRVSPYVYVIEIILSEIQKQLESLGFVLPQVKRGPATYEPFSIVGNLLFLSGQGARNADNTLRKGKLGATYSVEEGAEDAKTIGLQLLATAQAALGDLDKIAQVVKIHGMVNATPDFVDHPKVIDACSRLYCEVFGERGKHSRTAMGAGSLPGGIAVEIEAIFALK